MPYEFDNIITIYETLCETWEKLTPEDQKGYSKCLYMLHTQLRKLISINLHIENKTLRNALYKANLSLDDHAEDKHVIYKENKRLKGELLKAQALVKTLQAAAKKEQLRATTGEGPLREVIIEYRGTPVSFYCNIEVEEFAITFQEANEKMLARKKNKSWKPDQVKCWFMDYYRTKGFICSIFK